MVPNLFGVVDPFRDLAETCGPLKIKPVNTRMWSLLKKQTKFQILLKSTRNNPWKSLVIYPCNKIITA